MKSFAFCGVAAAGCCAAAMHCPGTKAELVFVLMAGAFTIMMFGFLIQAAIDGRL